MDNKKTTLIAYQVDEIKFTTNSNREKGRTFQLSPEFSWSLATDGESEHELLVLQCELFKDEQNPPFNCLVKITGEFEIGERIDKETIHRDMLSFLIPYMRALVSQITAVAQVKPVHLPIIDIDKLLTSAIISDEPFDR